MPAPSPWRARDDRRIVPDRALPFTFVEDLDVPVLDDAERHHLERVRRLRPGDRLTVGDGAGRFRTARFGASLEPDGPIAVVPRPDPPVTIAFALTKGDRPELAVQKLTELGVDDVVPFTSERTVVRWEPEKAARNVARWRSIAREAAAQSHRPWLPRISDVVTFEHAARLPGATLADPDGTAPTLERPTVLVGPEGGWSPEELGSLSARTCLGRHILRAETAALAAGAILTALRGGELAPLLEMPKS